MYEKQMKDGIEYPVEVIQEYHALCDKLGAEKMVKLS